MPNGSLFDDDPNDLDHPSRASGEAQQSFPDNPPAVVEPCTPVPAPGPAKKKKGPAPPPCSAKTMTDNLAKCDGGTNVFADAKAANGAKDPTVKVQDSVIKTGGSVDTTTGTVSIDPTPDCCKATQTLVQELSNLSHKKDFSDLNSKAAAGDLGREDYAKAEERTEYDGVKKVLTSFDKCKKQWGCAKGASSIHQWARGAKDFDDYYQHRLGDLHKNYYRNNWDKSFKATFDTKHPPAPPPGPPPHPSPSEDVSGDDQDYSYDREPLVYEEYDESAPAQYAESEPAENAAAGDSETGDGEFQTAEEGSNEEA